MGSAATYHLSKQGYDVLGLEQFDIPHSKGSSHGVTRIIRKAYFEDLGYVPLLDHAYDLWKDLEEEYGQQLLFEKGSIAAGRAESEDYKNALLACEQYDLPYEILSSAELSERYPAWNLPDDYKALFQPDGGYLDSDRCLIAHVQQAQEHGATIKAREKVIDWRSTSKGIKVETNKSEYTADRLVITAGAWISDLVNELQSTTSVERQVLTWLQPTEPENFDPSNFPVFTITVDEGQFYGFPEYKVPGFKFGKHHHEEELVDPNEENWREPTLADEQTLRNFAERYLPTGAGSTLALRTCMYTNSPDENFIIDTHPDNDDVVIATGFSGHGYKFCSVVGEVIADLVDTKKTEHPIGQFSNSRF
ncbi:N-methyl-L-tryptophan oxidase (plasmid) [Natrinema zhouii]|uniref:N-methyl-L-tryptophan oxidase n=1 Tax=Natrinema zhouii TaxID=1710539 RepID=UPI001E2882E8|nr:N-methyl-L-tryptophan oxidase [Natrinema zhouii]UHQ98260.1 N-methyl-L-tryptophan oxidase [Natrinema zhouii]